MKAALPRGAALIYTLLVSVVIFLVVVAFVVRLTGTLRVVGFDAQLVEARAAADAGLHYALVVMRDRDPFYFFPGGRIPAAPVRWRPPAALDMDFELELGRLPGGSGTLVYVNSYGVRGTRRARSGAAVKLTSLALNYALVSTGDLAVNFEPFRLRRLSGNLLAGGKVSLVHEMQIFDDFRLAEAHVGDVVKLDSGSIRAQGEVQLSNWGPLTEPPLRLSGLYPPTEAIYAADFAERGMSLVPVPLETGRDPAEYQGQMLQHRDFTLAAGVQEMVPPSNGFEGGFQFTQPLSVVAQSPLSALGPHFTVARLLAGYAGVAPLEATQPLLVEFSPAGVQVSQVAYRDLGTVTWEGLIDAYQGYFGTIFANQGRSISEEVGLTQPSVRLRKIVPGAPVRAVAVSRDSWTVLRLKSDSPVFVRGQLTGKLVLVYEGPTAFVLAEHEGLIPGGVHYADPARDQFVMLSAGSLTPAGNGGMYQRQVERGGANIDYNAELQALDDQFVSRFGSPRFRLTDRDELGGTEQADFNNYVWCPADGVYVAARAETTRARLAYTGEVVVGDPLAPGEFRARWPLRASDYKWGTDVPGGPGPVRAVIPQALRGAAVGSGGSWRLRGALHSLEESLVMNGDAQPDPRFAALTAEEIKDELRLPVNAVTLWVERQ